MIATIPATHRDPHTDRDELYWAAIRADARLTVVLKRYTGRDRWTMKAGDYHVPEVGQALREKLNADAAWLEYMQAHR